MEKSGGISSIIIACVLILAFLVMLGLAAVGVDALSHPDCSFSALSHGCQ
jgi:hypothetical protein